MQNMKISEQGKQVEIEKAAKKASEVFDVTEEQVKADLQELSDADVFLLAASPLGIIKHMRGKGYKVRSTGK